MLGEFLFEIACGLLGYAGFAAGYLSVPQGQTYGGQAMMAFFFGGPTYGVVTLVGVAGLRLVAEVPAAPVLVAGPVCGLLVGRFLAAKK